MRRRLIRLPHGAGHLEVEVPERNLLAVLHPGDAPGVRDEAREVTRAVSEPIGSRSIGELARGCKRAVIVADDNTRVTPTRIIVPAILEELEKAGVKDEQISVVMALGTHRPMSRAEFVQKLGGEVAERVHVENHDFRDPEKLVSLGTTPNGTPVFVNRHVYEADWKIGVGNIVPHHISGWAGGAKIVQPGVCGEETTASTHLLSVRKRGSYLGAVENPIRQEMEAIARKTGLDTVFNTVLNRRGRIVRAFYGDTARAFRAGVKEAERIYCVEAPAKADIVLASSHPCDLDFWQAHKTLYSSYAAVKDGGTIVIVTPCPEGVSKMHPELLEIAHLGTEQIEARLKAGEIQDKLAAALAIAWSTIRKRATVLMVPEGIRPEHVEAIGFRHCETAEEALELAFKKHGEKAKVTVLEGAEILPVLPERSP